MVIFTNRRRAVIRRRDVVLGKNTLIYNQFPRSAGKPVQLSVTNSKVRTDLFQLGSHFFGIVPFGNVFHLF